VRRIVEMDVSMFRQLILSDTYQFEDINDELQIFDRQDCKFFYDESNNIRKLWLDEHDFNAPIDRDFILGGVMHFGRECKADVNELKNKLRLQKSVKEMKFKHISKSKDFLGCLSEPKVIMFLQWLYESDLYIHYANVNNLYWAIIDIVESIDECAYLLFTFQMKNELYKIARANYSEFYQLLVMCKYPNVTGDDIKNLYRGVIDLIDRVPDELSFELEVLRQGMKAARRQNELTFLQGNESKTVLDSYFPMYLRPIGVFASSQHIFDNEYLIEGQFKKYDLFNNGKKINSFEFVNSKDNNLIQVSDCVVGLLGKYYTYINGIDMDEAHQMFETIDSEQKRTLELYANLIFKSENLTKVLFNSTESIEEHDIGSYILNNAKSKN